MSDHYTDGPLTPGSAASTALREYYAIPHTPVASQLATPVHDQPLSNSPTGTLSVIHEGAEHPTHFATIATSSSPHSLSVDESLTAAVYAPPSPISASIAKLSKAELISQLQQARLEAAQREATAHQSHSQSLSSQPLDSDSLSEAEYHAALESEMSYLTQLLRSKADINSAHAHAAAELESHQRTHQSLTDEIKALQDAIELERLKRENLQAKQQLEVQALRVRLEAERLEKERAARLLAARIAQVKMEIQELKNSYRLAKQRSLERAAHRSEENEKYLKQEEDIQRLKLKRESMEKQQREMESNNAGYNIGGAGSQPPVLKTFALDPTSTITSSGSTQFQWPGSPSNGWYEPEACIRHVLRLDASFRIVTQPDHRRVRLKSQPFAKGGLRLAYVMEDLTHGPNTVFRLVAKESQYSGAKYNSLSSFYGDVRSQLVARAFAQRFNRCHPPKLIQFLSPMIYEFPHRADPDRRYMAVELFLEGEYRKYSDNFSFVNNNYRTIPAFCHWSWSDSGQQMMITDLQGVGYVLTDPQIHSITNTINESEFGMGSGDQSAMEDFFASHHCNEICQSLALAPHPKQAKLPAASSDNGQTRAHLQYATELMGECGHLFVLQVKDRRHFIEQQGKMMCAKCATSHGAVSFFPKER